MGLLSTILGTGGVITKGFDLIDSLHTSETEAIEAKAKAKTDLLTAYAPFKIAQRYIALMFSGTFLFSFFLVLSLTIAGIGDIASIKAVLSEFYIGEIMLTIVVFYFGGGFAEGAMNARKPKNQ
jgi:tRNA isopentenyl-2-thiomethyl-A-37 hydroxylase MiaE